MIKVIKLEGEIDYAGANALSAALVGSAGRDVVVDLSEVSSCDASGFGTLVAARKRGVRVRLSGAAEQVKDVLYATGLDRVFPVHANVRDAVVAAAG